MWSGADASFVWLVSGMDYSRTEKLLMGVDLSAHYGISWITSSWYCACSIGLPNMNPTDKKTTALALQEQPLDTEKLLLDRLNNSSTSEDYFRWMLFVVGFYRGINKIDAATELLEGFIKIARDIEQSAHCYLALGQMATDEQRHEDALKHFTLALELAPKNARSDMCCKIISLTVSIPFPVSRRVKSIVVKRSRLIGRAQAAIEIWESA